MNEIIKETKLVPTADSLNENTGNSRFSKQDVEVKRPSVKRSTAILRGPIESATNGGHLEVAGCMDYLAGANLYSTRIKGTIHMKPLKHVSFSKLKATFYSVYIPHTRVWNEVDADRFFSQKVDRFSPTTVRKIPSLSIPYNASVTLQTNQVGPELQAWSANYFTTSLYREMPFYGYHGIPANVPGQEYSALETRGYYAAYNDIFRNKLVDPPCLEFKDTIPSDIELGYTIGVRANSTTNYAATGVQNLNVINVSANGTGWGNGLVGSLKRPAAPKSYYTVYRSAVNANNSPVDTTSLFSHVTTQQLMDEFRGQVGNEAMTDAEVIAKIRGAKVAKENKCFIIGQKTVEINLSLQPQQSENEELTLGADGAFSYTPFDIDINTAVDGYPFTSPREGKIHYFYAVTGEDLNIWHDSVNIESTKLNWNEHYRPSLEVIKDRPMYAQEISASSITSQGRNPIGWVDNFSEYFRFPAFVRGDSPVFATAEFGEPARALQDMGFFVADVGANREGSGNIPAYRIPSRSTWSFRKRSFALPTSGSAYLNSIHQSIYSQQTDYTDEFLRRLLLAPGLFAPVTGSMTDFISDYNALFQIGSERIMTINATIEVKVQQPISERIASKFIAWGEE